MANVAFTVKIHVKPGKQTEFLELLTPVLDAMRHEPGFINAVLHHDANDPARFMLYETWTDLDDVKTVQLAREYRQAYHARLDDLLEAPREIEIWYPDRADFAFLAGRS